MRQPGTTTLSPVPTSVDALTPGLLLFFARPSALQTWAEKFGHEWRHCGITFQTNEGVKVAAFGGDRMCYEMTPQEKMGRFTRVGVARVFNTDEEIDTLSRWCRTYVDMHSEKQSYLWSSLAVGPLHVIARRLSPGIRKTLLMLLVQAYCVAQTFRRQHQTKFVCSTFMWSAIQTARTQPLRLPLTAHPDDEAAYATPETTLDVLLARWLAGPTELWKAIPEYDRAELVLPAKGAESPAEPAVIDLTTPEVAAPSNVAVRVANRVAARCHLHRPFVRQPELVTSRN